MKKEIKMFKYIWNSYIVFVYFVFYFFYHYFIPLMFAYFLISGEYNSKENIFQAIKNSFFGVNLFFIIANITNCAYFLDKNIQNKFIIEDSKNIKIKFIYSNLVVVIATIITFFVYT